jgi:hypothetical protein
MADVHEVEATVRKDDALLPLTVLSQQGNQFISRGHFCGHHVRR